MLITIEFKTQSWAESWNSKS